MVREFANGPGDLGSIAGRVILKVFILSAFEPHTSELVLNLIVLNLERNHSKSSVSLYITEIHVLE